MIFIILCLSIKSRVWSIKFDDKACEVLKIKEFTYVNDCFQNEHNAVSGLYRQTLINYTNLYENIGDNS